MGDSSKTRLPLWGLAKGQLSHRAGLLARIGINGPQIIQLFEPLISNSLLLILRDRKGGTVLLVPAMGHHTTNIIR